MRACLCGEVGCKRHGRRTPKRSTSVVYGADHQERARRLFLTTPEICARCGKGPIHGDPWEAGHRKDVAIYGPNGDLQREHRSCNRRAGAQTGSKLRKMKAEEAARRRMAETYRYLEEARG